MSNEETSKEVVVEQVVEKAKPRPNRLEEVEYWEMHALVEKANRASLVISNLQLQSTLAKKEQDEAKEGLMKWQDKMIKKYGQDSMAQLDGTIVYK